MVQASVGLAFSREVRGRGAAEREHCLVGCGQNSQRPRQAHGTAVMVRRIRWGRCLQPRRAAAGACDSMPVKLGQSNCQSLRALSCWLLEAASYSYPHADLALHACLPRMLCCKRQTRSSWLIGCWCRAPHTPLLRRTSYQQSLIGIRYWFTCLSPETLRFGKGCASLSRVGSAQHLSGCNQPPNSWLWASHPAALYKQLHVRSHRSQAGSKGSSKHL